MAIKMFNKSTPVLERSLPGWLRRTRRGMVVIPGNGESTCNALFMIIENYLI